MAHDLQVHDKIKKHLAKKPSHPSTLSRKPKPKKPSKHIRKAVKPSRPPPRNFHRKPTQRRVEHKSRSHYSQHPSRRSRRHHDVQRHRPSMQRDLGLPELRRYN